MSYFDYAMGHFHFLLAPIYDSFILNSLEKMDFTGFMYRYLREHGYDRVVSFEHNKKTGKFTVCAYDRLSYYSYLYPKEFEKLALQSDSIDIRKDKEEIEKFFKQISDTSSVGPHVSNTTGNVSSNRMKSINYPTEDYGRFLSEKSIESLNEHIQNSLIPALESTRIQTAILFPLDALPQAESSTDAYNMFLNLRQEDCKSVVIFYGSRESDFDNICLHPFIKNEYPKGEGQLKEAFSDKRKPHFCRFAPIQSDDIKNFILRKKFVECDKRFEEINPSAVEELANQLYRHFTTDEKTHFPNMENEINQSTFVMSLGKFFDAKHDKNVEMLIEASKKIIGPEPVENRTESKRAKATDIERVTNKAVRDFKYLDVEVSEDDLYQALTSELRGQSEVLKEIACGVADHFNTHSPKKPWVYIAMGPTGVGKTETVNVLIHNLNKLALRDVGLIQIDLNTYQDEAAANRITGSATGYVGYGDATPLDRLSDHEYNIVLLDEFEKAHPAVWNVFYRMFNDGVYTSTAKNRIRDEIDCKKTIFALASNVEIDRRQYIAAQEEDKQDILAEQLVLELTKSAQAKRAATSAIRPLVGRIDQYFKYNNISEMDEEAQLGIVRITVEKAFREKMSDCGMALVGIDATLLVQFQNLITTSGFGARQFAKKIGHKLAPYKNKWKKTYKNKMVKLSGDFNNLILLEMTENTLEQDFRNALEQLKEEDAKRVNTKASEETMFTPFSAEQLIQFAANKENLKYQEHTSQTFYKNVEDALLFIESDSGSGSAFLFTPDGYAITCDHVIANASNLRARLRVMSNLGNSDSWHNCTVMKTIPGLDIAVIKLEGRKFPYMKLAAPDQIVLRDERFVLIGYPFGKRLNTDYTSFHGIVASSGKQVDDYGPRYLINSEAKCGNSGGPIISKNDGNVIGILLGSTTNKGEDLTEEINFMRPISCFWEQFTDWKKAEEPILEEQ